MQSIDDRDAFAPLFVQKDLIDELLDECEDKTAKKCAVKVNSDFQYGQYRGKTSGFLVDRDRGNKPYQHRFINSELASKFAIGAQQLAELAESAGEIPPRAKIAIAAFKNRVRLGKAYIGYYLCNF
jgi:hypothetical protein